MTTLLEAAKQALEALENVDGIDTETKDIECLTIDVEEVITALRQAIERAETAQGQEPIAWIERDMECDDFDPDSVTCTKPDIAAKGWEWVPLVLATTPPAAPVHEQDLRDVRCECCGYMTYHREHMGCIRAAAQPALKPMTEEQIRELYGDNDNFELTKLYVIAFARSIEAAHGITVETK